MYCRSLRAILGLEEGKCDIRDYVNLLKLVEENVKAIGGGEGLTLDKLASIVAFIEFTEKTMANKLEELASSLANLCQSARKDEDRIACRFILRRYREEEELHIEWAKFLRQASLLLARK